MTHEGLPEIFIGTIAMLCYVGLAAIALWVIYRVADKVFLVERSGEGTIIGKRLARPHTSVTMQSHSVRYGNSWRFIISIGEHEGEISIDQGSVRHFRIGSPVLAKYSIGRLSRRLRIYSIERQDEGEEEDHEETA